MCTKCPWKSYAVWLTWTENHTSINYKQSFFDPGHWLWGLLLGHLGITSGLFRIQAKWWQWCGRDGGLVLTEVMEPCQATATVCSNVAYVFMTHCVLNCFNSEEGLGKYFALFLHISFSKYSSSDEYSTCIPDLFQLPLDVILLSPVTSATFSHFVWSPI